MIKYNKKDALIFNTVQMYLKNKIKYLEHLLSFSKKNSFVPGVKVVRGAYIWKKKDRDQKD